MTPTAYLVLTSALVLSFVLGAVVGVRRRAKALDDRMGASDYVGPRHLGKPEANKLSSPSASPALRNGG